MTTRSDKSFSWTRIGAVFSRYFYLYRTSWPRILELIYWPTIFMLLWGFLQKFVSAQASEVSNALGAILAGFFLWDMMFRSQMGLAMCFMEDLWSRNLGHLLASPLRPHEWVTSLVLMSLVRAVIGILPATFIAMWLFDFSIYGLGWSLGLFFFNLVIFGWSLGLFTSGLMLRFGMGAESIAWGMMFAIMPFAAAYYPIDVLPGWLQPIALAMPAAHIFEGMRGVIQHGILDWSKIFTAMGLNTIYMIVGAGSFMAFYRAARVRGMILQIGE